MATLSPLNLNGSLSTGGSINSSRSTSWSNTAGNAATASSNSQALTANTSAAEAWRKAAEYNAEQARIQREWQERMANTVYQRSVKDMKAAGINPILAAGMGLGTASVGSGSNASLSSPEVFMGQSFAEQNSSSTSESHGTSWQNSESGLATGLELMSNAITGLLNGLNASKSINIALTGLENLYKDNTKTGDGQTLNEHKSNGDYSDDLGTSFKKFIKKPTNILKSLLDYNTMKSSGGMMINYK